MRRAAAIARLAQGMPSKYDRLVDHLATRDTPAVTLSFADVEAIVGPLPQGARKYAAWWGVTKGGRYHYAHTMQALAHSR
jgi:hypothetical protein